LQHYCLAAELKVNCVCIIVTESLTVGLLARWLGPSMAIVNKLTTQSDSSDDFVTLLKRWCHYFPHTKMTAFGVFLGPL